MTDVLDAATYRSMLDAMPERRFYHDLMHKDAVRKDGSSTRLRMYLYPELVRRLPEAQRRLWLPIARALCSRELEQAFKRKFRAALENRFQQAAERIPLYPVPILVRDLPGYKIGIHADTLTKAITVQFYLPRDDAQTHLGTIFHEGRKGEAALRVRRLAFRPATGYAFPVVHHESWHSVAQTSDADGQRDSLMLTYYVQDSAFRWLLLRLKRFWTFVVYDFGR